MRVLPEGLRVVREIGDGSHVVPGREWSDDQKDCAEALALIRIPSCKDMIGLAKTSNVGPFLRSLSTAFWRPRSARNGPKILCCLSPISLSIMGSVARECPGKASRP